MADPAQKETPLRRQRKDQLHDFVSKFLGNTSA